MLHASRYSIVLLSLYRAYLPSDSFQLFVPETSCVLLSRVNMAELGKVLPYGKEANQFQLNCQCRSRSLSRSIRYSGVNWTADT